MSTHKDLDAWKFSVELVTKIYKLTSDFPKEEVLGITNQMRRAAVSVPSNIAEGAGRNTDKEFVRYLYISLGSLQELDTQIMIAHNLEYLSEENYNKIYERIEIIGKLLNGLINYLKKKMNKTNH